MPKRIRRFNRSAFLSSERAEHEQWQWLDFQPLPNCNKSWWNQPTNGKCLYGRQPTLTPAPQSNRTTIAGEDNNALSIHPPTVIQKNWWSSQVVISLHFVVWKKWWGFSLIPSFFHSFLSFYLFCLESDTYSQNIISGELFRFFFFADFFCFCRVEGGTLICLPWLQISQFLRFYFALQEIKIEFYLSSFQISLGGLSQTTSKVNISSPFFDNSPIQAIVIRWVPRRIKFSLGNECCSF